MQVWLNGRLVKDSDASISVFDRGFLFGDAVYEVVRFFGSRPVGMDLHIARLRRSLALTSIDGFDAAEFPQICEALLQANSLRDASVYLQVTRGAAAQRTHLPTPGMMPTIFACASACGAISDLDRVPCVSCNTAPDQRWLRCEIKTTALLGNLLPMLAARDLGSDEVILIRNGLLSEGTSTNVFAEVSGRLVTPPVESTPPILNGVMRTRLLEACAQAGIPCSVRPVSDSELRRATEIVLTASRRIFSAVTTLDGTPVGSGGLGPLARRANAALVARLGAECETDAELPLSRPILAP
ncbi:MAG: hypothetical protein EXS03_05245 [Phycisphaerales bacterium]|nr:hypothetical protein [Phycisphaerales bacterium]